MKLLYIGYQSLSISDSGGALGCIRNHHALIDALGDGNVTTVLLENTSNPSIWNKVHNNLIRIFSKNPFSIKPVENLNYSKFDIVFIDSSRLGNIAKMIVENGYKGKVISFYHNFDYRFECNFYKNASFLKRWINTRVSLENERNASRYSATNVVLNKRDAEELRQFYGMENQFLIPVSLPDRFKTNKTSKNPYNDDGRSVFLFLGSYFFGNVVGLDWFMENVYPHVDMRLVIVGKDMKKLMGDNKYKNVEIFSDVDDVTPYLVHADCMLYPLKGGSGMKIKTCEALMFGKNIIGTKEAFEGYDIDVEKVGACCESADEFISAIRSFNKGIYNQYSRDEYLKKYSSEATLKLFKELLNI